MNEKDSEENLDQISNAPSVDSSEVFASPNECLRGLTNVDLMQIADNGEVFQQFVKSMSAGDYSPTSPNTSHHEQRAGYLSPNINVSPRVSIPRRHSLSSPSLRLQSHNYEAERNLRSYLQDSGREGQDRRHILRRRLARDEEFRRKEARIKEQQNILAEQLIAENSDQSDQGFTETDFGGLCFERKGPDIRQSRRPSRDFSRSDKSTNVWQRIVSRNRSPQRCPLLCEPENDEDQDEFIRRMDQLGSTPYSRRRKCMDRIRRFFRRIKNSLVRFTRYLFCCHCYSS